MLFRLRHVLRILSRLPKSWTTFLALFLALIVGVLDYATGYDLHVTVFYLLPVSWACWMVGRRAGLLLAIASAVIFGIANFLTRHLHQHPIIPLWNAVMLLTVFVGTVWILSAFHDAYYRLLEAQSLLRSANDHLEKTVAERTAALKAEIVERERMFESKIQIERLLERQEKLAVLGTLTAGIAHEIRNPLTSVKGSLYLLEKHVPNSPGVRKQVEFIGAEVCRLERIVKDALSFARPSDPVLEKLAVATLLLEVQGLMSPGLDAQGVSLAVEASPDLMIQADSGHLKQALINLIQNGAEAIVGTGTVTLRTRTRRASLGGRETDAVVLEVVDDGKGILPEVAKRLFDPYFSTKETGTGLGLSIAARIVEKHGGVIQHQSSPGLGTTFEIVLPLWKDGHSPASTRERLLPPPKAAG